MNKDKKIDLMKKRNKSLTEQVETLQFELDYNTSLNNEGFQRAKDLIVELEQLKARWEESIAELDKCRDEYESLIFELREMKKIMKKAGFKIPWYKKIKNH